MLSTAKGEMSLIQIIFIKYKFQNDHQVLSELKNIYDIPLKENESREWIFLFRLLIQRLFQAPYFKKYLYPCIIAVIKCDMDQSMSFSLTGSWSSLSNEESLAVVSRT